MTSDQPRTPIDNPDFFRFLAEYRQEIDRRGPQFRAAVLNNLDAMPAAFRTFLTPFLLDQTNTN